MYKSRHVFDIFEKNMEYSSDEELIGVNIDDNDDENVLRVVVQTRLGAWQQCGCVSAVVRHTCLLACDSLAIGADCIRGGGRVRPIWVFYLINLSTQFCALLGLLG